MKGRRLRRQDPWAPCPAGAPGLALPEAGFALGPLGPSSAGAPNGDERPRSAASSLHLAVFL